MLDIKYHCPSLSLSSLSLLSLAHAVPYFVKTKLQNDKKHAGPDTKNIPGNLILILFTV